jgi:preprotein translocase subunit SecE
MILSSNINKMYEFIKNDMKEIKKLLKADTEPRIFRMNKSISKEILEKRKIEVEIVERNVKRLGTSISRKNHQNSISDISKENYETNMGGIKDSIDEELEEIDISYSMDRLQKSKILFNEKMNKFKSQMIDVGESSKSLESILIESTETINDRIVSPIESQIITIQSISADIDKINVESRNQLFRTLFFVFGVIFILILFCVLAIFILQTTLK